MKLITSMVRPERVDAIKGELRTLDVQAISVAQVQDHSPQNHGTMVWRAHEYTRPSSLKMEIRIVVDDDQVYLFIVISEPNGASPSTASAHAQ